MSDPNDILFDRTKKTNFDTMFSINTDNSFLSSEPNEIQEPNAYYEESKKNFINQLLTIKLQSNFDLDPIENFYSDPDMITNDMFIVGRVIHQNLLINIPNVINMGINLLTMLRRSILQEKFNFINLLLDNKINLVELEPKLMLLCAIQPSSKTETDNNMNKLINKFLDMRISINADNYACVYMFASTGRLDVLKKIIELYKFNDIRDGMIEIVCKICAVAIKNDDVRILSNFMPVEIFDSIPDIIFEYFLRSIQYGDNIEVVKYFINGGVSVEQEKYRAIVLAKELNREKIIEFFEEINFDKKY